MSKKIPAHVAIIMDGNRRWAKERKLAIIKGHDQGSKNLEPLIEYAKNQGIKYITFWAFSSENWKRGPIEVDFLMAVFRDFLHSPVVERVLEKGVKINIIGDFEAFPKDIVTDVKKVIEDSKNNKAIVATFALNYGGRQEILRAVNKILNDQQSVVIPANAGIQKENGSPIKSGMTYGIDEKTFSSYLYTNDLPDPDLIIRTGGMQRLSGFLPWQSVYSELYFCEALWPDFDEKEFDKALEEYANRERRFGK